MKCKWDQTVLNFLTFSLLQYCFIFSVSHCISCFFRTEQSLMCLLILCNSSPLFCCVLGFSWGVPLAITVAALALQKIGYDASEVSVGWCWVSIQETDHVLWMLLTGKIWELLAYVTLPVLYILIKRHIHKAVSLLHWCLLVFSQCSYTSVFLQRLQKTFNSWPRGRAQFIVYKRWF